MGYKTVILNALKKFTTLVASYEQDKITMTLMTRETGKSIQRPHCKNNAEMVKADVYTDYEEGKNVG